MTATELIFIPKNKQQLHHSQTNDTAELQCVRHEQPAVPPHCSSSGFPKIVKITKFFKMFKHAPLSPAQQ
jgi:hypothetical protein